MEVLILGICHEIFFFGKKRSKIRVRIIHRRALYTGKYGNCCLLFFKGYDHVKGQVLDANELKVLFEGLKLNKLHHFSHLLTGTIFIALKFT